MGELRLALRGLRYHRRMHAGLLLGTVLTAAILTGALGVGDSADYTLRTLALLRLGSIHTVVVSGERLFAEDLGKAVTDKIEAPAATVLLLPGMAIRQDD